MFTPADLAQLADHGLSRTEAERQLAQLRGGQVWTRLARPCTPGDGICQITPARQEALSAIFAAAARQGEVIRLVPASGAATRMFQPLQGASGERGLARLLADLDRFPFASALAAALSRTGHDLASARRSGDLALLLAALLEPHGLDYAHHPKGLLPFHCYGAEVRTAFVEHLAETAQLVGTGNVARLHFTVSPEHLRLFETHLEECRRELERRYQVSLEVGFSIQDPATDTVALGPDGEPLRDADDRLVLRPGGHGALLANLAQLDAQVVLLRNIDNVVPDLRRGDNLRWDRVLAGLLLDLLGKQRILLEQLELRPGDAAVCRQVQEFLGHDLGMEGVAEEGQATTRCAELLDRPLRVCGMVVNHGEPGGGPFWVRGRDGGLSRQIVEAAQVDRDDPAQAAILAAATHFNPVIMACAARDRYGHPYGLTRFADQAAAIVTGKMQNGQPIRILERPGLWNGGMAGWLTVFVELPESTFNPVKTVFDLLRPAHQPGTQQ